MLLQKCDYCGQLKEEISSCVVPLGEGSSAVKDICESCKMTLQAQHMNETTLLKG